METYLEQYFGSVDAEWEHGNTDENRDEECTCHISQIQLTKENRGEECKLGLKYLVHDTRTSNRLSGYPRRAMHHLSEYLYLAVHVLKYQGIPGYPGSNGEWVKVELVRLVKGIMV